MSEAMEDETEVMDDVELSSDEESEDEDNEVSLIVLKRPKKTIRTVTDIEVVSPSSRSVEQGTLNTETRTGIIKEYIETEGLGILLSKEVGIVLFHLDSVWINGRLSLNRRIAKEKLYVGIDVEFIMRSFHGEEYFKVSEDSVVHQAVAVWTGYRPESVLKVALGEENTKKLEDNRRDFMLLAKGDNFMRVSLVRVRAEAAGYLSDSVGILEYEEGDTKHKILFHANDVKIFTKNVESYRGPCKKNLPVGCSVTCDARRVHIAGVKNVEYQAMVVLAGSWPPVPFPSMLQGGKGSTAPDYDVPENSTFYYLELPLEKKLSAKVDEFKRILKKSDGKVEYDWRDVEYIRTKNDYLDWKYKMGGDRNFDSSRPRRSGLKDCIDSFKRVAAVEEEMAVKTISKQVEQRTWYTPEAWQHGGLRLKEEVKNENREESAEPSPVPSKRPKLAERK